MLVVATAGSGGGGRTGGGCEQSRGGGRLECGGVAPYCGQERRQGGCGSRSATPAGTIDIDKRVLLECDRLTGLAHRRGRRRGGGGGDGRLPHHLDAGPVPILAHLLGDVDAPTAERGEARGGLGLGG